ncbi:MAG: ATP-binding protein [Deltaproteobacteria bacterium]
MTTAASIASLLALGRETEWIEFKHNNDDPEMIGEYASALSNSAALLGQPSGYIVWGIDDATRKPVGTTVDLRARKIGNEEFENWLSHQLEPRIGFEIGEAVIDGQRLVYLCLNAAVGHPVSFKGAEFIRVGTLKKKLKDHPGKEADLWRVLERRPFETGIAAADLSGDDVIAALDYPALFQLLQAKLPEGRAGILGRLETERLVRARGDDRFDITNLGALLFARQLAKFDTLSRKAVRVIRYRGNNRVATEHEQMGGKGYAAGFEGLVDYVNQLVPANEHLADALRSEARMYPKPAIRELVANAMIHQDLTMSGTGPMVEVFDDRVEISNPGLPLIPPNRFIDHAPRSRNEILADLMRRVGICEERGSGLDKVISEIEFYQLPPPDIRVDTTHTRVVLFAHQDLARMGDEDRVRACYQHCCLRYVSNEVMTNTSLRKRLRLPDSSSAVASRIIAETITAGLVKPADPQNTSRKHARYIPFWA